MPKTAVIEGRLDMRDLATCADFFAKINMPATSRSDLLYRIVATFAESAIRQGATQFTSTEDALGFMMSLNIGMMNRPKREGRFANTLVLSRQINTERIIEGALTSENNELEEAMKLFNNQRDKEE